MSQPDLEIDLIARAQRGDRSAFSDLVHHHRGSVVNVVYRMCGDPAVADDAAQETFIRVWQRLPDYKPIAPFRNWVFRIATNVALDILRKERETVDIESVSLEHPVGSPERIVADQDRAETIQQAISSLPPGSRSVLVLREFEGLSYKQMADILDIPVGTVMSRLNYARTRLREKLAAYLEVSG